jgi:hypothetical protein
MASQIVQMDYKAITVIAQQFETAGESLEKVRQDLELTMNLLQTAAFCGSVLAAALVQYLSVIKTKVDLPAKVMYEFSKDMARAVVDHEKGQYRAGTYFGEGFTSVPEPKN